MGRHLSLIWGTGYWPWFWDTITLRELIWSTKKYNVLLIVEWPYFWGGVNWGFSCTYIMYMCNAMCICALRMESPFPALSRSPSTGSTCIPSNLVPTSPKTRPENWLMPFQFKCIGTLRYNWGNGYLPNPNPSQFKCIVTLESFISLNWYIP